MQTTLLQKHSLNSLNIKLVVYLTNSYVNWAILEWMGQFKTQ
jgi:hypothetical protein